MVPLVWRSLAQRFTCVNDHADGQTGGEAMPSGEHRLQVLLEVKKDKLSDAQTRDRTGDKHPTRTQRSS